MGRAIAPKEFTLKILNSLENDLGSSKDCKEIQRNGL